jgi:hypothetical protein
MTKTTIIAAALVAVLAGGQAAHAAVTADEAAKLKTTLTPLGGEKAANKDGSIPAWNGGITKPLPGKKLGVIPTQIFADEKPLYQVTAKNAAQYADLLSDGTKALLAKYPDSFRLDVYPSHRTAAAPQEVYDNVSRTPPAARPRMAATPLRAVSAAPPSRSPRKASR